ncbi:MAG: hypothetical protein AAGF11_36725 [Myxococcota bacterium]
MSANRLEGMLKAALGQIVTASGSTSVLCEEVAMTGSQITLWAVLYRGTKSAEAQVVGQLGKKATKVVQKIIGSVALAGIPQAASLARSAYGSADKVAKLHQKGVGVDLDVVGSMQVAGAMKSDNRQALYYALEAAGRILIQALVRIGESPGGNVQLIVLPVRNRDDAMASRVLIDTLDVASAARRFEVDSTGRVTQVTQFQDDGADDSWSLRAG